MKISFSEKFTNLLSELIEYISKDKPKAARKFKVDLLRSISKDLKKPFHYRKSIYFEDESIRDYIFKGYTVVYKVKMETNEIIVFGLLKFYKLLIYRL